MSEIKHVKYKYPLLALGVLLLAGGYFSYTHLKTGLFPDITFPKIKVIADAGQQPVDKMMTLVTVPLENIIRRTEGLDYIRSTTSRGSCEISVFLKWKADVDKAKQQIESLMNEIKDELPVGTSLSVEKMNPSILPVMGYSLEGNRSQVELRKIAQYQIKPFLAAVQGVSDIVVVGGRTKEYQIILKPYRLTTLGITPQMIQKAVVDANLLESNGYISDFNRMYLTITDNAVDNLDELKDLVLVNSPNRLVRLKDVADVEINEVKEYIKINANGKDVPLIAVIKQPDANLIEVNTGIEEKVTQLKNILPKDVKLIPFYKQADFVNDSIRSIKDVLWIGIALSLIVVILFLRSFSASTVVLVTIPIALSLTLIMMYAFGYTFNIMTLGAIAASIGLMIDDAVIVVEQVHKIKEDHPQEPLHIVVSKAIRYLFPAMVGSSLSTTVIFVPFILMSGVAGAYFKVLAFTMIIALACSFFVSWLVLPILYLVLPNRKIRHVHHPKTGWIQYIIKRPIFGFGFIAICFAILLIVPSRLPSGFLPEMDEGSIVLDFLSPAGSTLEESDRMLQMVDSIVKNQPEVESYSRRLGTQLGFFITEPNNGDYLIQLKKNRKVSTETVSEELREKIEGTLPQLTIEFGQVIGDMLGDLMSSVQPIEIKVFGDDRVKIENLSKQIADVVNKVEGAADVYDGITVAGPDIIVKPNVPLLAQCGLSPADFQFQLQTQIEGTVISKMLDKEQQVGIRMIYPNALKTTVASLQKASIILPNGSIKPLKSVASFDIEKGVVEINRENQKMMGVITARLSYRDLGSTLKDIKAQIAKNVTLPAGYHIEYAGSYAQQQQAFKELMLILIAAILLVFIVILFLFKNIKVAISIILLAVLGVAGCVLGLLITGTPLNVGSYTGIIMIVGIIGENAIFTYLQYQEARRSREHIDSIVYSIASRLRPKLMTAFGTIIAIFPLALGIGTGAQLHQPLAIVVISGLIFALPLLLLVFPTLLKYIDAKQS